MRRSLAIRSPLLALLLACVAGASGCSLAFQRPVPKVVASPSRPYTGCSTAPASPVIDTLLFGLYGAYLVTGMARDNIKPGTVAVGGVLMGVLGASAIHGFRNGARCADLLELNARCIKADQAACLALNPEFDPALPARLPTLCAQDADCEAWQACVESACVGRPTPVPAP
jgi:hypothetical protein